MYFCVRHVMFCTWYTSVVRFRPLVIIVGSQKYIGQILNTGIVNLGSPSKKSQFLDVGVLNTIILYRISIHLSEDLPLILLASLFSC